MSVVKPKQISLPLDSPKPRKRKREHKTPAQLKAEADEEANLMAARIYQADPERYPGVLQQFADAVLSRVGKGTK